MKKFIILTILVSVIGIGCVFADGYIKYSSKFIKRFKNCDNYQETITSNFEGNDFTTQRNIIGWRNGLCRYQEVISSSMGKYKLDCGFASIQVEELYNAMKNKSKTSEEVSVDLFSLETDPKTGEKQYVKTDSTLIKGSKAYTTWSKYQNNPYFCVPTKI